MAKGTSTGALRTLLVALDDRARLDRVRRLEVGISSVLLSSFFSSECPCVDDGLGKQCWIMSRPLTPRVLRSLILVLVSAKYLRICSLGTGTGRWALPPTRLMSEQYDIRIPDHIVAFHFSNPFNVISSLNTPRGLRNAIRRYHNEHATINPPSVTTRRYDGEPVYIPEEIIQAYVLDVLGNRDPDQLLITSDIAYKILRWRFSFVDDEPSNPPDSPQVSMFLSDTVLGDPGLSELILVTATVDVVPLLSDKKVVNEFCVVFDSGCTTHTFNTLSYLSDYRVCKNNARMTLAKKNVTVPILGYGTCKQLGRVLYVPVIEYCLLSIRQLDDSGYDVQFSQGYARVIHRLSGKLLLTATLDRQLNLYTISQDDFEHQMNFEHRACMAHSIKTDKVSRLHYIFNHASAERIRYLCKCHSFPGLQNLSVKQVEHIRDCEFCRLAKIHKKPSCKSVERHSVLGQMWNGDTKGPIATPSLRYGNKYVFGLIESKSRFLIQYFMKSKNDVMSVAQQWINTYIKPLRAAYPDMGMIFVHTDNGEFNSKEIHDYLLVHGVYSMLTCPYTPQHNAVIERIWRTITEAAIALLLTAELPETYWQEARKCAGHVYNRMVCAHPEKYPKSPFEELFGVKPHVAHFQPWGCIAFSLIHVKPKNHTKRGDMCVFVGYSDRYHVVYRLYSLTTKDFIITSDATFVLISALNSLLIN